MIRLRSRTVGFKEWSLICDALGSGRQSIILRKGGIAEGRGGFQWQAAEFVLFPTHFHEQVEQTTWHPSAETRAEMAHPDSITIRFSATIESTHSVTEWPTAHALAPFHVWNDAVIRERFGYGDAPGLSLAIVRVLRLAQPWTIPMSPRFGGCRSWLDLPEADVSRATPILDDHQHRARMEAIMALLGT
jgi:hypothetical protein